MLTVACVFGGEEECEREKMYTKESKIEAKSDVGQ